MAALMATAKPIVIFDSGVGGLSIHQEIKKCLPGLPVVYCADFQGFPYGPKAEIDVIERTSACLNRLAEEYDPALAVIACNTASTISLPRVREELDFPVVGVVPAIKTASERSKNRCIGLLATPGTIVRSYTDQLINEFAGDCQVIRVGSSELVIMAEQYLRGETVNEQTLKEILSPFLAHENASDTIVLGCTHFPILSEQLRKIAPDVEWIDSGAAIARRVSSLLSVPDSSATVADKFVYTGESHHVKALLPSLHQMGFEEITSLQTVTKQLAT